MASRGKGRSRCHPHVPASTKALAGLPLSCRVQAVVAAHPITHGSVIEAQADDGLRGRGSVGEADLLEARRELVRTVPGVKEVIHGLDSRPTRRIGT